MRWTRHVGHCWRSRDELISHILLWTSLHECAKARWPAGTYIQQLCANTGCSLKDLPGVMDDREGWWEIHAGSATWWWWWYSNWELHLKKLTIFHPIYLKALITFCILDVRGPLLLGTEIKPSYLYMPVLFKYMNLPSVSKMSIPTRSAICTELNDPIVKIISHCFYPSSVVINQYRFPTC